MATKLKCGCEVSDEGKFIVGERCLQCRECKLVSTLHPFGSQRI